MGVKKKKKVKVQVYSLVSSAKRHSPHFTQLSPGHRTCSFISHFNSLGSIRPSCHFQATELFKHTSLHCPTRYPLTPGSRECTCDQSALPRSTTLKHIQHSRGSNPQSLAGTSGTLALSHDAPHLMYFICEKRKLHTSKKTAVSRPSNMDTRTCPEMLLNLIIITISPPDMQQSCFCFIVNKQIILKCDFMTT